MYSGNAGLVHDFRDILEAMRLLKDDPRIFFLFVGDGPQRPRIEAFAAQHGITNFAYRDYVARDQLRLSLSLADVHLLSLRAPFVGIAVPGKLYGIMASGRPALFVGPAQSESAETIDEARCGVVVDPERGDGAERIVRALRGWESDPAAARAVGDRGRAAFLAAYEKDVNCAAFERVIRDTWPQCSPAAVRPAAGRAGAIAEAKRAPAAAAVTEEPTASSV
jgi:glycosyltransferase involved in cell wall biosynthesis